MPIRQLSNEYEAIKAREWLDMAIAKGWNVNMTHLCPKRSDRQNRFLYAILGYFATITGMTVEQVKQDIFKKLVNPEIFCKEVKDLGNHKINIVRSSKDLTTAEMTLAINRFRNFASSELGIFISSPEDESFILYCEQQINNNKEYL